MTKPTLLQQLRWVKGEQTAHNSCTALLGAGRILQCRICPGTNKVAELNRKLSKEQLGAKASSLAAGCGTNTDFSRNKAM